MLVLATAVPRGSGSSREATIPLLDSSGRIRVIYIRVAGREHSVNTILRRAS